MSKETTIVFIYDTKKLQNEEDDPATAILYFHPTWVSDTQRTVLCGQLIGIIHCLRKLFGFPEIISLESGKFCVNKVDDRFLLAVGTDRNVADWTLLHRNNILNALLKFYHNNVEVMAGIYGYGDALSAKMYHVCETYLKVISFGGNPFSIIPTISLPRSASNVFVETHNILQYCQTYENVLGGLILYHNKVVTTQLSPVLTKNIVFTDPYRIKSPAEPITTTYHLPIGVQLLQVYITHKEHEDLTKSSQKLRKIFKNLVVTDEVDSPKDVPIVSGLKRDCSLLFTTVPEEDTSISPNNNVDATIIRLKKPTRPKFLNLKNKISDIKEFASTSTKTPFTPGSVLSTPMTELNKVLHLTNYSICTDPEPCKTKQTTYQKILSRSKTMFMSSKAKKNGRRHKTIADPTNVLTEHKLNCNVSVLKEELIANNKQSKEKPQQIDEMEKISRRKSLTLPLKSLSIDSGNVDDATVSSVGLLTPLMQKLSFPHEKKTNGFVTTPLDHRNHRDDGAKKNRRADSAPVGCALFICGQQDTVLAVLLDERAIDDETLIGALWEIGTANLCKLEKQLHKCMESYPSNVVPEQEPYSFLSYDAQWDTLKRGGPWETGEAASLSRLHRDFRDCPDVTEVLCRSGDGVLFGVHQGDSEVFYNQSESAAGGLPTPSDSMGHVPLRAKRSLERDHSIILL